MTQLLGVGKQLFNFSTEKKLLNFKSPNSQYFQKISIQFVLFLVLPSVRHRLYFGAREKPIVKSRRKRGCELGEAIHPKAVFPPN